MFLLPVVVVGLPHRNALICYLLEFIRGMVYVELLM